MIAYLKKFGATLLGSYVLGITLAIVAGIPWRFIVTLAIFLFILNTIIEQSKNYGAITGAFKKIALLAAGTIIFVGLRGVTGYFLDMQAGQVFQDLISTRPDTSRLATNMVFELLFLVPGVAIAYLVVQKSRFWKTVLVLTCTILLACFTWTIKQRGHTEAMKRQTQAVVSLNARGLNNKALINEAAAATSFGVAKEQISVWYQWDGTNIAINQAITNAVLQGQRVLQLRPNDQPVVFESQAFTEVVLQNTNGSFIGGTKVWVEAWKFNWIDGKSAAAAVASVKVVSTYIVNRDEVISTLSVPDNSMVYLEADKAFCILEKYGVNDDGSEKLSRLTVHPGKSNKHFPWGGTVRVIGLYDNTTLKLHL